RPAPGLSRGPAHGPRNVAAARGVGQARATGGAPGSVLRACHAVAQELYYRATDRHSVFGRPPRRRLAGVASSGAWPRGRTRLYGVVVDGDAASGATARCTVVAWGVRRVPSVTDTRRVRRRPVWPLGRLWTAQCVVGQLCQIRGLYGQAQLPAAMIP